MQNFPQVQITDFCTKHHIRRLSVFGSRLQGNNRPDSDLDILVEFDPGHTPGLDFFGMQDELSEILGVKVDLNTLGFLSPYFRDEVLQHAELIYAQS
ncbi:MAG: nucleotidyltransferase family protein [Thermoguttaceae bacterium]